MLTRVRLFGLVGLVTFATVVACSGSADQNTFPDGTGKDDITGGSSGSSGGFGDDDDGGGSRDGAAGDGNPANCFAPVDMYIMFDNSGSMGNDCNVGDNTRSKWCRSINALSGYFNSPGAKNQGAALQFFPGQNHTKSRCATGDGYNVAAQPATDYLELPTKAFDQLLNTTSPSNGNNNGGGTPTEAAIRGLTRFTEANRRTGRVTIGILITDGKPNGCNEDTSFLSNLLKAHYEATKSRTYVIGMQGAEFDNLEEISLGGEGPEHANVVGTLNNACGNGAQKCHHWNVGDGDPAAFTAALAAIQESADGCKPGGGVVNPPR